MIMHHQIYFATRKHIILIDIYSVSKIIITTIDFTMAMNASNLMILVSFERRDCQLLINCLIVKFEPFDANVQLNRSNILIMVIITSYTKYNVHKYMKQVQHTGDSKTKRKKQGKSEKYGRVVAAVAYCFCLFFVLFRFVFFMFCSVFQCFFFLV